MDWKGSDCDRHGFRSSFRDWAAEKTKFPREVVEAALAHKVRPPEIEEFRMTEFSNSTPDLGEPIPLLASPQGGVAASLIKWCEATEKDAAGVVFLRDHFIRKTTPASRSAEASRHFLDRSATPPCGDARRGVRSSPISGSLCFPQAVWNPCRDQDL